MLHIYTNGTDKVPADGVKQFGHKGKWNLCLCRQAAC